MTDIDLDSLASAHGCVHDAADTLDTLLAADAPDLAAIPAVQLLLRRALERLDALAPAASSTPGA